MNPPSEDKYRALLSLASKTAGSDNWKTSAGRVDGPDGFVLGDAWKILKIRFKSTSKPSVCPVCMDTPSSDEEWHVTKSCRHAVCRSCLQNYAMSLANDPNHSGPLKCPCCPRLLRVEDAKVAFALDEQFSVSEPVTLSRRKAVSKAMKKRVKFKHQEKGGLFADPDKNDRINSALQTLEKWDTKQRDEMLRSMPSFRPCPHCSKGNGIDADGTSQKCDSLANHAFLTNGGGGFVTPECLQPINEERESKAERMLNLAGNPSSNVVLIAYAIYYLSCASTKSNSPALQMMSAIIPSLTLPALAQALRLLLATIAKREVMRSIVVTCPCCSKDFNLEASSELNLPDSSSETAAEAATRHWKNTNTRPCPSCSSPIMKDGGCNHVKCGKCRVDFCWACMRPRTSCRAYQCKNGAPFGNVIGNGTPFAAGGGQGMTLIERIDSVEAAALRNLRQFGTYANGAFICATCIGTSFVVRRILSTVANVLVTKMHIVFPAVLCLLGSEHYYRGQRRNDRGANVGAATPGAYGAIMQRLVGALGLRRRANNMQRRSRLTFQRPGLLSEEDQIAEAIARSLVDQ